MKQSQLTVEEFQALQSLDERLRTASPGSPTRTEDLRALIQLRRVVNTRTSPMPGRTSDTDVAQLHELATAALRELGSNGDPPTWSLGVYDAERFGTILGVSDDGGAAPQIARAFLTSPKANVLRELGALSLETIGCCVDAERIGAAGELLAGPDEYAKLLRSVDGLVPMTTNVGSIVLPRFFRPLPSITVTPSRDPVRAAISRLRVEFSAFVEQPGHPARPVVLYINFRARQFNLRTKVRILTSLREAVDAGTFGDPRLHRLGLLQRIRTHPSRAADFAIDVASQAGIKQLMIEGDTRLEAQDQLMLPGLLAYFAPRTVNRILRRAHGKGINVVPKNEVDVGTATRTIWSGLTAARGMGAHLGKFGLFPLTFEQQLKAIAAIPSLFPTWSAAPAFYVDRPIVGDHGVYMERQLVDLAIPWLRAAAGAGIRVALFDAPDRTPAPAGMGRRAYRDDRGRRLVKRDANDRIGVLTFGDVKAIAAAASQCQPPVRVMWAGGLDGRQAYDLAREGAFGIYTTSTTARAVAIADPNADPSATVHLEPTYFGVLGMRMAVEAGFLLGSAERSRENDVATEIAGAVEPVLLALTDGRLIGVGEDESVAVLDELRRVLEPAWRTHFKRVRVTEP
jgi:hypothetical protein